MRLVIKNPRRVFQRDAKYERRAFCSCELCRLDYHRMLWNRVKSGEPLRSYRRYLNHRLTTSSRA